MRVFFLQINRHLDCINWGEFQLNGIKLTVTHISEINLPQHKVIISEVTLRTSFIIKISNNIDHWKPKKFLAHLYTN